MGVHIAEILGAWALDAVDGEEGARVEAHLGECSECAAQARHLRTAVGWLGIERTMNPPTRLRETVLDEARRRRPPVLVRTLTGAYAGQVALLDRQLGELGPEDWSRPDPRHGDVAGLIRHLAGNDATLAADLDLPVIPMPGDRIHAAWRRQADILLEGLADDADLDRTVTLAGRDEPGSGPLRRALVQRAFETWTHLDDVRNLLHHTPVNPPPEQVRRIVSLAVTLLPTAVAAQGVTGRPGSGWLVLTGPAGGEWPLPLGEFTIRADAVEFARLVANRRSPDSLEYKVDGDRHLAAQVLRIASTLGCD
ncbi:MAG TPA: zf-HC2 domain-containing protein [Candidatus Limnocylindrales bacterium]